MQGSEQLFAAAGDGEVVVDQAGRVGDHPPRGHTTGAAGRDGFAFRGDHGRVAEPFGEQGRVPGSPGDVVFLSA